jgi:hypothetical protein
MEPGEKLCTAFLAMPARLDIAYGASLDRTVILLILLLVVLIGFGILGLWREWLPF